MWQDRILLQAGEGLALGWVGHQTKTLLQFLYQDVLRYIKGSRKNQPIYTHPHDSNIMGQTMKNHSFFKIWFSFDATTNYPKAF